MSRPLVIFGGGDPLRSLDEVLREHLVTRPSTILFTSPSFSHSHTHSLSLIFSALVLLGVLLVRVLLLAVLLRYDVTRVDKTYKIAGVLVRTLPVLVIPFHSPPPYPPRLLLHFLLIFIITQKEFAAK